MLYVSELEEQVKELKKLNESLKGGSKVILRKETVIEFQQTRDRFIAYSQIRGDEGLGDECESPKVRRTIESSESYVNFEDVRLKVEQAMKDEVNRSIHDRNMEKQSYADRKNKLDNEYNYMKNKLVNEQLGIKANLQKEYEKKAKDLEEEYSRKEIELRNKYSAMVRDFESEKLRILNLLPNVHKYAEELHDYLDKRFFVTNHAIMLANDIVSLTTKRR